MKKSELRQIIREEVRDLNEAHFRPEDNILDDITFDELITTVEGNEKSIDERSVTRVFNELMKSKINEAKYVFKKNIKEIIKYINAEDF
jgi:DNA gyrase/topoisomerase IV subunit B